MRYRVLSGLALLWSVGCGGGGGNLSAPPPPEVTVAEVKAEELEDWDEYQGEFEAVDAVDIRPRVRGEPTRVAFTEGKDVRKGDILFEIDPDPYQATLDQRRADLTRTQARLSLTERDAERGERMAEAQAISREEQDTRLTLVSEARAAVQAAEAAVRAAELDLGYTRVRSPVAGRTSRAEVTEDSPVTGGPAGCTLLTTIVSIDPIYVYFEGDEAAYLRYAHLDPAGRAPEQSPGSQSGADRARRRAGVPHRGQMDFVDNRMDRRPGPSAPVRGPQSRSTLHARLVRARPPHRQRQAHCRHGPRAGGQHRPGPQVRLCGQRRQHGRLPESHPGTEGLASAASWTTG